MEAVCTSVAMVITEVTAVPFGVKGFGLKVQVVNDGNPEQAREVDALNPPAGVMVMVEVAELPLVMVAFAGESVMVKLGAAVTVSCTTLEVEGPLLMSPA